MTEYDFRARPIRDSELTGRGLSTGGGGILKGDGKGGDGRHASWTEAGRRGEGAHQARLSVTEGRMGGEATQEDERAQVRLSVTEGRRRGEESRRAATDGHKGSVGFEDAQDGWRTQGEGDGADVLRLQTAKTARGWAMQRASSSVGFALDDSLSEGALGEGGLNVSSSGSRKVRSRISLILHAQSQMAALHRVSAIQLI